MFIASSNHDLDKSSDPALTELMQYSAKAQTKKAANNRSLELPEEGSPQPTDWLKERGINYPASSLLSNPEAYMNYADHAAPLMPLRERDIKVLVDLFTQNEEIEAIEADIIYNLLRRCPEPCWEDDPSDFLREFL